MARIAFRSLLTFLLLTASVVPATSFLYRSPSLILAKTGPKSAVGVVTSPVDTVPSPVPTKDEFNWFKAWYPLVPVEILDPEVPHKFQLLGMDLVVWNDAPVIGSKFGSKKKRPKNARRADGGTWRAFLDECPHRKVPLSEGRVEDDGTLLCSYHAWRFDGDGTLVDVPQLEAEDALEKIRMNPKSRCNSFPTQVIDGVLWVWAETGEDAVLESALQPAANYHVPDDVDKSRLWVGGWNFRVLPYSADYFIENVVDPAHVAVSHHNVIGSRYESQVLTLSTEKGLTKKGFANRSVVPFNSPGSHAITTFTAPTTVTIESFFPDGASQVLELLVSPSVPGYCNHVGRMVIVKNNKGRFPALLRAFTFPLPLWLNHVFAGFFLNQDAAFLHQQERKLASTGTYLSYRPPDALIQSSMYAHNYNVAVIPTYADLGVTVFRTWLAQFAGGVIPYKNNHRLSPVNMNDCFDQFRGHTQFCQICQRALSNVRKVRLTAFFMAAASAVLLPWASKWLNLATVVLMGGTGMLVSKLIGLFYKYEFSHAHND